MFVNSGATDIALVILSSTAVERAIVQCTSRWAMARGHRLNTSIVLAAVHGLSGLFRAVSAVEPFTLSSPSHSVPVPNRPTRLCGRKATLNQIQQRLGHLLNMLYDTVSTQMDTLTFLIADRARLSSPRVRGELTVRLSSGSGSE